MKKGKYRDNGMGETASTFILSVIQELQLHKEKKSFSQGGKESLEK